jgi:hypothetical protein
MHYTYTILKVLGASHTVLLLIHCTHYILCTVLIPSSRCLEPVEGSRASRCSGGSAASKAGVRDHALVRGGRRQWPLPSLTSPPGTTPTDPTALPIPTDPTDLRPRPQDRRPPPRPRPRPPAHPRPPAVVCTHTVLILYSYCTHYALYSYCTHYALYSYCTHYALYSLCTMS